MTSSVGYVHYADRGLWQSDFCAYIENERPIVQALTEPTPLITLRPDRELISLFRGHYTAPDLMGDVGFHHILSADVPKPHAQLALKYSWSQPIVYTMTLVLQVPACLDWLTPALRQGSFCCGIAPRPDLGLIGLPLPDDLQGQLVMLAISIMHYSRRRRGGTGR